jgi:hypothetical protein
MTTAPAPAATVSPDGRSATDGTRTLAVARAAGLDPEAEAVTVTGEGYDEGRGIYVSLCAVTPDAAPGPCRTGSATANRWVSSNPPDYGVGIATPFEAGGTFEVELAVAAVIDASTDCRRVACAIVTRADDTAADDRTLDLAVPVSFAATSAGTSVPDEPEAEVAESDESASAAGSVVIGEASSSSPALLLVVVGVLAALAVAGAVALRARRGPVATSAIPVEGSRATAAAGTDPSAPPAVAPRAEPGSDQP